MTAASFRGRSRRSDRLSAVLIMAPGIVAAMILAWLAHSLTASASPARKPDIVGVASVIDADTLEIHGARIRLVGVDAPESHQKCLDGANRFYLCGSAAANALDVWIAGNPVSCTPVGVDRYKRTLAECRVRGQSVQSWLVLNGHALAYRAYSTAYVPDELKARDAKLGVWSGSFIEPWTWRRGQRLPGEKPTKAMLSASAD